MCRCVYSHVYPKCAGIFVSSPFRLWPQVGTQEEAHFCIPTRTPAPDQSHRLTPDPSFFISESCRPVLYTVSNSILSVTWLEEHQARHRPLLKMVLLQNHPPVSTLKNPSHMVFVSLFCARNRPFLKKYFGPFTLLHCSNRPHPCNYQQTPTYYRYRYTNYDITLVMVFVTHCCIWQSQAPNIHRCTPEI